MFKKLGSLQTLTFKGVKNGWDVYNGKFERGTMEMDMRPLSNGKLDGVRYRL